MKILNKFQKLILGKFILRRELNYSQMKPIKSMENNKFQYHLDQLKKLGLIEKVDDKYQLTYKGKQYVSKLDLKTKKLKKQAKLGVAICCTRNTNKGREYLIFTRHKQPFYGCQGLMAGKIEYGESVIETAVRELKEETKMEGKPVIMGINHYCTVCKNEVVDDLMQFLCWVDEPTGILKGGVEGKYKWVSEKDLAKYIKKPFQSLDQFMKEIEMVKNYKGMLQIKELRWENKKGENF